MTDDRNTLTDMDSVVLRPAGRSDRDALLNLAALDSALPIDGSAIVALRGGELEAAISLHSGRVIADPFRRTDDLVPLLQTRYALLSHAPAPTAVRVLRRARGALAF